MDGVLGWFVPLCPGTETARIGWQLCGWAKTGRGSPYAPVESRVVSFLFSSSCLPAEQAQAEALDDILRATGECVTQVRPHTRVGGQ